MGKKTEDPWFRHPNCDQLDINLCYFVAMLMQIFHAFLVVMGRNREDSLSGGGLSTASVVQSRACACSRNNLSVFFRVLRLFQIAIIPGEHCACVSHMSVLSVGAVQGLQCTRVNSSLYGLFQLQALHTLVSKIWTLSLLADTLFPLFPPSNCTARDFVYVESKVTCVSGGWRFFPRTSLLLSSHPNLSSAVWLQK